MSAKKIYTQDEIKQRRLKQCRDSHKRHKEKRLEYDRSRDRLKTNARARIRVLVYRGKLEKLPCTVCGNEKSQAHHADYSKPLEIVWLCARHHKDLHRKESQSSQ